MAEDGSRTGDGEDSVPGQGNKRGLMMLRNRVVYQCNGQCKAMEAVGCAAQLAGWHWCSDYLGTRMDSFVSVFRSVSSGLHLF